MADEKRPSIFKKIVQATEIGLESYISKARSEISEQDDEAFYRKSVAKDLNFQAGSQGWLERGTRIGFAHLKQMSVKDTIVAAVIQTRQNQAAAFTKAVKEQSEIGFRVRRKNEEKALRDIMEELFGPEEDAAEKIKRMQKKKSQEDAEDNSIPVAEPADGAGPNTAIDNSAESKESIQKAKGDVPFNDPAPEVEAMRAQENQAEDEDQEDLNPVESLGGEEVSDADDESDEDDLSDREKLRMAKEELRRRDRDKVESLADFISNCGYLEDRPFETRRWDFEAYIRAMVRDTYTYDIHAMERVRDQAEKLSYFVPVDGSTVRFTTPEFNRYKTQDLASGYDILYPEKELEALKETDAFELDKEKLKEGDYKYCQVIRGRVERAFSADELCVGMRNPTSDIYSNGYSISELELLIGAVSSHIFTENYNHSYYTQGFSAKGILHIKAPINRRKLETIRIQWKSMLSGSKNSFQTPIFAGMDEVQWIPLTQNHSDMEFSNWMNYLIKIICAIYQIDPAEIGFGMREEGGGGGSAGQTGTNTEQKLESSKDKGLKPLMRHIENFINKNVMAELDADFVIEFSGLHEEDAAATVERQSKEVKFKKSINEIREEDGLPPIEGADDLILDPTFFQWFTQFHPDGKKNAEHQNLMQQAMSPPAPGEDGQAPDEGGGSAPPFGKSLRKALRRKTKTAVKIEYYQGK